MQEAENKQKQYNADYQKAVQARNEVLKRNKDAQAQLDNLKQERTQLEKKLAEAQKNGVKLVHDQDTNKAVSTSDAKSEAQEVSQDYEKQKQALSKAEAEYQQETAKADSAYQKAGIDANVANQKNTELAQTAEKASKVEGVTVVQDADENKPADPSNEVQVANDNTKDIQDQIDNINKQIEQIKSENEQIKSNNAIAKQQFDQDYAKWEKGNEVYISKLAQTSGWSKEQIKSFFGNDLSNVTYINANPNATVDYGNLQPLTSDDWDLLKTKMPHTYSGVTQLKSQHYFKFQKGSTWTYKNAFLNSQTGQAVDAKFTVIDYQTDPKYEALSPALTLNGGGNQPANSMIIDFTNSITPNITIKVQYLDSNTGKPVKLNALFGIGDIDGRQMVKVYNAKKALLGNGESPLNGSNYLGAIEPKGQGFSPEEIGGQAWFILSPSDSTTFTFGYNQPIGDVPQLEFGVGNIATIYQGNKPILEQSPLKTTTIHWHKSNVALKPKNKVAPKEVHYHFTNLSFNPEKVPDLPPLKQSEVHYHNVDLVLDPHPLPDKTKQITITDTSKKTKEGTQTYHFVDKNTGKVLTTNQVKGEVGKDVPISLKVPDGYKLVEGQKVPTSASIKGKDNPINILVEKISKPSQIETPTPAPSTPIVTHQDGNDKQKAKPNTSGSQSVAIKPQEVKTVTQPTVAKTLPQKQTAKLDKPVAKASKASNSNVAPVTKQVVKSATLPQTGNSKSTAGVLAGTALVATMASLGIAYSKKKSK